jgi:hypothetical protein
MVAVKMLLFVTCPACSLLILAPLYFGPLPVLIEVAFAIAQPLATVALYKLVRNATIDETLNEIERRRQIARSQEVSATAQLRRV